jgi:hypothetical protein
MVRHGRGLLLFALALRAGMPSTEPATAAEIASIQATLNSDGSGEMLVNGHGNPPDQIWSWEVCAPVLSSCTSFATGQIVETTGAPSETVFKATSNYGGATALSPVWHGNASSLTPPTVTGVVRANELVTPVSGQWSGGWEGGVDYMQLSACSSPTGEDCTTLTHSHFPDRCPNEAAVLDPAFTGQYLRVANWRLGAGPIAAPSYAVSSPYSGEAWATGTTISAAVVGRIASATGPRTVHCGAPPLVKAFISKRGVAAVRCGRSCHAVLVAKRGQRTIRRARKLAPSRAARGTQQRPERWWIPRQALLHAGLSGPIKFFVEVDGKRVAQRTVLVPD